MAQVIRPDIIVIGASSGGLEALLEIVPRLPRDLAAAIFLVMHVPAQGNSQLPAILSRNGALPAVHAKDNDRLQMGHIYVAPPDFHLLLRKDYLRIVRGPRENNHRPAIDPLFRSAARAFGARVIGVVLSGLLDDGAAGVFAIKSRGGIAIVQDPQDAVSPDMPRNAMAASVIDYCVSKYDLAELIVNLTSNSNSQAEGAVMADKKKLEKETEIAALEYTIEDDDKPGNPSVHGCPDCGGTLWELQDGEWLRFRCRVGHAYSAEGLLGTQGETLETALWNAFRNLQENASLARRLADRARTNKNDKIAETFDLRSQRAEEQARLIQNLLANAQSKNVEKTD